MLGGRLPGLKRGSPRKSLSCEEFCARFQWDFPQGSPAKRGLRRSHVRFVVTACSSYSTNTSRRTSGLRAAIVRRALAAPDGCRRPCSHSWSVRVDTPNTCANRACERPERVRASVIADTGMRWTRAALPAFISCTARSSSSPMLRLASRLRRSFSVIFDIYCLSNFLQNLAWYCLSNTLRVHREQPDLTVGQTVVVDHAHPSSCLCLHAIIVLCGNRRSPGARRPHRDVRRARSKTPPALLRSNSRARGLKTWGSRRWSACMLYLYVKAGYTSMTDR